MVQRIPLTQGLFALVDDADFDWLGQLRWCANHPERKTQYALCTSRVDGLHRVLMHRAIMAPEAGVQIDHIDHDGLNNTRANLRLCTGSQNAVNYHRPLGRTGYRGVRLDRCGVYRAAITVNGQTISGPGRPTAMDSAMDYDDMANHFQGSFAILNFPEEVGAPFPREQSALTLTETTPERQQTSVSNCFRREHS